MAGTPAINISYARQQLRRWIEARDTLASGQSYSIGGRTLTRSDTDTAEGMVAKWHRTVLALEAQAEGRTRPMGSQAAFEPPGRGAGGIIPQDLWTDWRT